MSSSSSNSTFICTTHSECGYMGRCYEGFCLCKIYTFGDQCQYTYSGELGQKFTIFRMVFLSITIVLTIYTIFNCYKSFRLWKRKKVAYRLKAISHILVLIFCLSRIVFFAGDPWSTMGIYPFPLSMLLYHFPVYLLFTSYQMLLLYWCGTYHNVATIESGRLFFDKSKLIFLPANFVWLICTALEVISVAFYNRSLTLYNFCKYITYVYNAVIVLCCLSMVGGFLAYGILLYKRIAGLPTNKIKKRNTLRKLLLSTIILAVSLSLVIIPTLALYNTGRGKSGGPRRSMQFSCFVHGIECILVAELLVIMKPRKSVPFSANAPGYFDNPNQIYLEKCSSSSSETKNQSTKENDHYFSPKKTLFFFSNSNN